MTRPCAAAPALSVAALLIGVGAAAAQFLPPAEVPGRTPPPGTFSQGVPQPAPPPRGGAIERQTLPPPPGATAAPPPTMPRPPTQPVQPVQPNIMAPPPGGAQTARPTQTPPSPAGQVPPGSDDFVVVAPPAQRIENRTAVFNGLDKITGRIIVFDVAIGETVQFGALQVTPRTCYTRPPNETPNTTGFAEIDEITLKGEMRRLFTGWMFAASPGLHGVEHPIYDIWLVDCKQTPPNLEATTRR